MQRRIISLALSLVLFLSLLGGISFFQKTSKVIADEVEGIELSVLKVWDDYNDLDELRPDSVEVTLYQNNQKTNIKATLSANNNWYYKYDTLVAKEDSSGEKINYTWKCDDIDDYERFEDNLDNMYVITDVHHVEEPSVNSVVLQKFNEQDEFFDGCNMILKNQSGDTLITWTTNDSSSIEIQNNNLSATMNSDGSLVVNNIPEGEYVYEEVKPKSGYTNAGRKEFEIEKGVHNYTYNWYTDIQDAVTDANNLNNNNADCYRDDEDCEAGLFIINNKAMLILIKDKDNCETISLDNNTVFDLENNDLELKPNNKIQFKEDLKILEGNVFSNSTRVLDAEISSSYYSSGDLFIDGLSINNNYNSDGLAESVKVYTVYSKHLSNILISNSNISNNAYSSGEIYCIYFDNNNSSTCINNSILNCENHSVSDSGSSYIGTLHLKSNKVELSDSSYTSINNIANNVFCVWCNNTNSNSEFLFNNNNISAKSNYNKNSFYNCTGLQVNGFNITVSNNNIESFSNSKSVAFNLNEAEQCDMWDNYCYAYLPIGVTNKISYAVRLGNVNSHIMSGYFNASPSKDSSSLYNENDYSSYQNYGLFCDSSGDILIDESRGETTIIGGNSAIFANGKSSIIVNGGTFKSPNYGSQFRNSDGYCEINGGTFKNNSEEYSDAELNGIHDYSALYLFTEKNILFNVNIRNATIIGGSHGLNVKSDTYYGATCHVYNSFIKSKYYDILLSSDTAGSKISNSYCYIENGTTFEHEGTDRMWYDAPYIYGLGQHIFDNRTQQETSTVAATTQGGE